MLSGVTHKVSLLQVVTIGAPGEEIALELTLRVVADVGLVVWYLALPKLSLCCKFNVSVWRKSDQNVHSLALYLFACYWQAGLAAKEVFITQFFFLCFSS